MKVGLTGGIGCGKSTVVALFREAGWKTVESDALVRTLLDEDPEVRAQLRGRWTESVFAADGSVDRKAVAGRVFADNSELQWLENVLHPRVRERWEALLAEDPKAFWLVEIPLLFEKRLETRFDLTVCVSSPPDVVESRMQARGYTRGEIEQRRQRQMPLSEKIQRADHLISNAGSLEFLKQQTDQLIKMISKR